MRINVLHLQNPSARQWCKRNSGWVVQLHSQHVSSVVFSVENGWSWGGRSRIGAMKTAELHSTCRMHCHSATPSTSRPSVLIAGFNFRQNSYFVFYSFNFWNSTIFVLFFDDFDLSESSMVWLTFVKGVWQATVFIPESVTVFGSSCLLCHDTSKGGTKNGFG